MKRIISFMTIMILMTIALSACSSSSPTAVVKARLDEYMSMEAEDIKELVDGQYSVNFVSKVRDFDAEIISESKNGDEATVSVEFRTYDFKTLIADATREALAEAFAHLFDTSFNSSDVANKIIEKKVSELTEKSLKTTVDVKLILMDGQWEITDESEKEIVRAVTGGLTDVAEGFMKDFSGTSSESKEDDGEKSEEQITEDVKYQFYEAAQCDGIELKISEFGTITSGNLFEQPDDDYIFYFDFDVTNISDKTRYISYDEFECYVDNYKVDRWRYGDDELSSSISPGRSTTGSVYFEIPKSFYTIEVEYTGDSAFDDSRVVFYTDRDLIIFEDEEETTISASDKLVENTTEKPSLEETKTETTDVINEDYIDAIPIGKEVDGKYLSFTIQNTELKNEVQGALPEDGFYFLGVNLNITNNGQNDHMLLENDFCCFADGMECNLIPNNEDHLLETVRAGYTISGTVIFNIPKDAESIIIRYTDKFDKSEVIFFKIK